MKSIFVVIIVLFFCAMSVCAVGISHRINKEANNMCELSVENFKIKSMVYEEGSYPYPTDIIVYTSLPSLIYSAPYSQKKKYIIPV